MYDPLPRCDSTFGLYPVFRLSDFIFTCYHSKHDDEMPVQALKRLAAPKRSWRPISRASRKPCSRAWFLSLHAAFLPCQACHMTHMTLRSKSLFPTQRCVKEREYPCTCVLAYQSRPPGANDWLFGEYFDKFRPQDWSQRQENDRGSPGTDSQG